jgi:hypothetical protein
MPHGRAFLVRRPKSFASDVLPRYFRQTKFLSFTRQLNLWGFKRITRGPDAGAYYHELFLRGRPYMANMMKRQKIKGTGMKLTPNPQTEPNFYDDWPVVPMPSVSPVPLGPLPPLLPRGGGKSAKAAGGGKNAGRKKGSGGGGRGSVPTGAAIGGGGGIRNNVELNADAAMLNALLHPDRVVVGGAGVGAGAGGGGKDVVAPVLAGTSTEDALSLSSSGIVSHHPQFGFHPGQQCQGYGGVGGLGGVVGNTVAANLVENAYGDLLRSTLRINPFDGTSIFSYLSGDHHQYGLPPSVNGGGAYLGGNVVGGRANAPPSEMMNMMGMMEMMGGGYHNPNNSMISSAASIYAVEMGGKVPEDRASVLHQGGRGRPQNYASAIAAANEDARFGPGVVELSSAGSRGTMTYPQHQQQQQKTHLSPDRLLMERLRDLDKLQMVNWDRFDKSSVAVSRESNIGGYRSASNNRNHLDSSWIYALREANRLEELALAQAQRARARSLAMGIGGGVGVGDGNNGGAGVGGERMGSTASPTMSISGERMGSTASQTMSIGPTTALGSMSQEKTAIEKRWK